MTFLTQDAGAGALVQSRSLERQRAGKALHRGATIEPLLQVPIRGTGLGPVKHSCAVPLLESARQPRLHCELQSPLLERLRRARGLSAQRAGLPALGLQARHALPLDPQVRQQRHRGSQRL